MAECEQMKSGGWLEVFGGEQALELGCDGDGEEGADAMSDEEGFVGGVGLMCGEDVLGHGGGSMSEFGDLEGVPSMDE